MPGLPLPKVVENDACGRLELLVSVGRGLVSDLGFAPSDLGEGIDRMDGDRLGGSSVKKTNFKQIR